MKKYLVILLCVLMILSLLTGCLPKDDGSTEDPNAKVIENIPADITIKVGETRSITLDENESGYIWKCSIPEDDAAILTLVSEQHLSTGEGLREFVLKGVSEGYVTLNCEYYSEDQQTTTATQNITVRVEK